MKTVFTFPGQGSQVSGMLHDIQNCVNMANEILGITISDTEQAFRSTISIQIALFVKEVAFAKALLEKTMNPDFVAGHSTGAFAAAVTSGVISFEDALKLLWHRAKRMDEAYPEGYGMGVITGLTEREVQEVINLVQSEELPVYVSSFNAELQIAVSGSCEAIDKTFQVANEHGAARTTKLRVPIPSHSPLMNSVALELLEIIKACELRDANVPYLANRTGRILIDNGKIAEDLALNVAYPVRWNDMTTVCVEAGADCFIEMPPGHVLTNLVKQAHQNTRQISVDEIGLSGTEYLINKWRKQDDE